MNKMKQIFSIMSAIAIALFASSWTSLRMDGNGKYINAGTLGKVMIEVLGEERTSMLLYSQQTISKDWEELCIIFGIDTIGIVKYGQNLPPRYHLDDNILQINDEEWKRIMDYITQNDIRLWMDLREKVSKNEVYDLISRNGENCYWTVYLKPFRLPEMKYDSYLKYIRDKMLDPHDFTYFGYYKMLIDEYSNIPIDSTMVEYGFMKKYPVKPIQKETKQHYIFK